MYQYEGCHVTGWSCFLIIVVDESGTGSEAYSAQISSFQIISDTILGRWIISNGIRAL